MTPPVLINQLFVANQLPQPKGTKNVSLQTHTHTLKFLSRERQNHIRVGVCRVKRVELQMGWLSSRFESIAKIKHEAHTARETKGQKDILTTHCQLRFGEAMWVSPHVDGGVRVELTAHTHTHSWSEAEVVFVCAKS